MTIPRNNGTRREAQPIRAKTRGSVSARLSALVPLPFPSLALPFLVPLAFTGPMSLAAQVGQEAAAFYNFRAGELDYAGPADDLTNLSEIRIGWFGPSDTTNAAADMWWAANFAVNEANQAGGYIGLPFRLLPRWSVDPWGTGVSQLTRMVYEDRPVAIIGGVDSASTHLAEQVVAKANLPLVSPVATDKSVTLAGVPWMFSCAPSDASIARALVGELLTSRSTHSTEANKLALVSGTDHESRMTAREVLRELSRNRCLPDFQFEVPPGAQAIVEQIHALAESRPAIVLLVAKAEDAARLTCAIRESLPRATIFGSHTMGRTQFLELTREKSEGVKFPLILGQSVGGGTSNRFVDLFVSEHHRSPDYAAVLAYDATRLLIAAVLQAGPNRARIRAAIHRLSSWEGLAGNIRFDGTGQNASSEIPLGTILHGVITPLVTSAGAGPAQAEPGHQIVHFGDGVRGLVIPGQVRDSSRRLLQPASPN